MFEYPEKIDRDRVYLWYVMRVFVKCRLAPALLANVRLDLSSSQGTKKQAYLVPPSVVRKSKKFNKIDTREDCWSSAWGNAESRRRNFRKFRIFLLRYFLRQKSSEVAKFLSPISKTLGRKQELKEGKN
jgi:hypothetical protein